MTQILSPQALPALQPNGANVGYIQLVAVAAVPEKDAAWAQNPALAPALAHLLANAGQLPRATGPSNRDVNGAAQKAQAVQALANVQGRKELLWLKRQAQVLGLVPPVARAALAPSPLGQDRRTLKPNTPAATAVYRPRPDDDDVMWTKPIAQTLGPKKVGAQLASLTAAAPKGSREAHLARTRAARALLDPSYRGELTAYLNRRGYVLEQTDRGVHVRPARRLATSEQALVSAVEVQKLAARWGLVLPASFGDANAEDSVKLKKFNSYSLDNSDHSDALLRLESHEVRRPRDQETDAAAKVRRQAMAQILALSFDPARADEAATLAALTRKYNVLPRLGEQTSNSAGARKSSFGLRLVELYVDGPAVGRQFAELDDTDAKRAVIAYGLDEDRRFARVPPRTMLKFAEPAWDVTLSANARASEAKASAES